MMPFAWEPKINKWSVSLYSIDPNIDCGSIAKKHGGGGHPGAAGFQCDSLPFELTGVRPEKLYGNED